MKNSLRSSLRPWSLGLLGLGLGLGCLGMGAAIAQEVWPNWQADPLYGTVDLDTGFTPDPYVMDLQAGGSTDVGPLDLGDGCVGYVAANQPDLRLNYNAGDTYPLSIMVESESDTTLVISGPDGGWYCNDDFDGYNPMVMFEYPDSGQYDIWVGHYGDDSTHPAQLHITEYDLR